MATLLVSVVLGDIGRLGLEQGLGRGEGGGGGWGVLVRSGGFHGTLADSRRHAWAALPRPRRS